MSSTLPLTPDELLTTTRSVRKRLDFSRPVERSVIEDCLRIAQQAPSGSNLQNWHFIVVTDAAKRLAIAELYRKGMDIYTTLPVAAGNLKFDDADRNAQQQRVADSVVYLAENIHKAPVFVIPCITFGGGRGETQPAIVQAIWWSSIAQAGWNFMLAARARGLGTTWTSLHLFFEKEVAEILGVPYDEVNQAGLMPVAYTLGTDFTPAKRTPLEQVVHWEGW